MERDKNIPDFFAKANQRRRRKIIANLEDNGVLLTDNSSMIKHATEFYKKLFGKENRDNFRLDDSFWREEEKVSYEDNLALEVEFTEEEIKIAIEGSYAKGALGPDGFSFMFYQKFWHVIKKDFMTLIRGFDN
jgi:hypothetical protein